jgi:RNA polymerase sigma-70 factor, ECF subfamily
MRTWRLNDAAVQRLHRRAGAERWQLPIRVFGEALESSTRRSFPEGPPDAAAVERYCASLHLEDLALACACAEGSETAWDHFVREYRPVLYRAAAAIDPTGGAREAADSLYGELFGLTERDGERRSHFRYFHGRSGLATWLRAVLAQRHVDRIRSMRRLDPLPAEDEAETVAAPAKSTNPDWPAHVSVMRDALGAALTRLAPRDRLRLTCYYAQELTLAQIGKALGEHEATVSRHLARTRKIIREQVEGDLRANGLSPAEMAECFATVVEDAGPLDLVELLGPDAIRKELVEDRSK